MTELSTYSLQSEGLRRPKFERSPALRAPTVKEHFQVGWYAQRRTRLEGRDRPSTEPGLCG